MRNASLLIAAGAASLALAVTAPAPAGAPAAAVLVQSPALEALGLENNPAVSWADRDARRGGHRFTGFRHEAPDGAVLTAAAMEIENPRMGADGAIFDSVRFIDLTLRPEPGAPAVRIAQAVITAPSPALAAAMAAGLTGRDGDRLSSDLFVQPAGEIELSGLRMGAAADEATGAPAADMAVERIFLTDPDGDGLAEMGLSGMAMALGAAPGAPPVEISLESIQASGVRVASAFNGMAPTAFSPDLIAQKSYDRLDVTNLLIEAGGVRLAMPALTSAMSVLSGGALRTVADMPSFALTVDPDADAQSARVAAGLSMLGYDALDLSYTASSVYEPETDRLYADAPNALTLRDGGTVDIRYDVTGLSDYVQSAVDLQADAMAAEEPGGEAGISQARAMELLSAIAVGGLGFSFEDAGLLERGLTLFASRSGVDLATARAQAVGMVSLAAMGAGEALPPRNVAQMSQALTGFVQNGGRVEVSLQPEAPMTFTDMMTKEGGFDAEAAGLSFSHEAP